MLHFRSFSFVFNTDTTKIKFYGSKEMELYAYDENKIYS